MSTREAVLGRIRAELGGVTQDRAAGYEGLKRDYVQHGERNREAILALMVERLREYDADVVECAPDAVATTIATQLAGSGRRRFVIPEGAPKEWLAPGFEWLVDEGLTDEAIEEAEGVVTGAFCGIADSGTIALHHCEAEGRRVLTLLPDWHLCLLRASRVVESLPEYFARCVTPPRLATYISGPSATADIEMTRIKGVHGPRFLNVILVRDDVS